MRVVNGWTLFEHQLFKDQKAKLAAAVEARKKADPDGWQSSPDAKLLKTIQDLTQATIPADPTAKQYRQGDTLGASRKHWFRAKFGNGRYRLFFQFNSTAKVIIYAWVNDEQTLRTYGASTDAYAVFQKMLKAGDPPDSWDQLAKAVGVAREAGEANVSTEGGKPKAKRKRTGRRR